MNGDFSQIDIVRAWKDAEYRATLKPEEKLLIPENPVGEPETDLEKYGLTAVNDAAIPLPTASILWPCNPPTVATVCFNCPTPTITDPNCTSLLISCGTFANAAEKSIANIQFINWATLGK